MKNIKRLFNVIDNSLFTINGQLTYERITDAIVKLANTINETETDEGVWSIGECGACSLDGLIVGAYWHYTEWHGGQWSHGYEALSALGDVFTPNRAMPPTSSEDGPEWEAYQALEELAKEDDQTPNENELVEKFRENDLPEGA